MRYNKPVRSVSGRLPPVVRRLTNMRPAFNCPLLHGDL
nr:MAG TPA: hypothetical protein [Caudoviricetes sp.]